MRRSHLLLPQVCHITPLLIELHWLPVRQRITFKLLLITFKTLHQLAPSYLSNLSTVAQPGRYAGVNINPPPTPNSGTKWGLDKSYCLS